MRTVLFSLSAIFLGIGPANGFAMKPLALQALLAATGGKAVACRTTDVARITTDSRAVSPGDLFWALQGERYDGHDFAAEALKKGAQACVVNEHRAAEIAGPKIVVDYTLQALWDLAGWYRTTQEAVVIGVTGSVGKTTTREMIFAALSAAYSGVRSAKNYNNHVGLPLSILEIEPTHEFAVLELGASRVGEIRDLAALAAPEIGVVTAIAPAHLESFGNEGRILKAKGELIEALLPSGFAVLAGDDPKVRSLAALANCPFTLVGEQPHNDLRGEVVSVGIDRLMFRADRQTYEIPATGRHHLTAGLCAVAIARELGVSPRLIAEGLRQFQPVAGRCQLRRIGPWNVIDDAYNANPCSMESACRLLQEWNGGGKKILVAGDMLELGKHAPEHHRRLGRMAAEVRVAHLLVYGEFAAHTVRGALEGGLERERIAHCTTFDALPLVLDCWLEPGDVVLVKGSRAMRMERVIDCLKESAHQFSKENSPRAPARECA